MPKVLLDEILENQISKSAIFLIKTGLQKVRVFMSEVLLGEKLGNQIGKNAIFHIKKVSFFTKQQSLQSLHGVLTKKLQKIPKIWSKRGQKFNIFGKFILLNRGFS